jgi:hypothetical protein
MSVKRRDLIKHFEDNGFSLLREARSTRFTPTATRRFPSKGIASSTESLQISSANKRESHRNSKNVL